VIFEKHSSISSLSETVALLTDKGDLNRALRLIHDAVERVITEPLCVSQVFGSKVLDNLCQSIGKANLAKVKLEIRDVEYFQSEVPVFVYVVTKLQKSGGHTQLIETFIKARPDGLHYILSTELAGKTDSNDLFERLGKKSNIFLEKAAKVSFHNRLTWLQKRLINLCPERVYLCNHHQDSIAVSAVVPEMELSASFYHHGDHHLCLGVYLPHFEHIDFHPMGYYNCKDELGIKNTYIPLMVEDQGDRPNDMGFLRDGALITCTAARSNKVEMPYFVNYCEMVPKILKATGGKHVHIGRLTPWALFRIRTRMKNYGIQPDCFIYIPWVPSVWVALHDYRVDLYIASFPYGGGLTLIEAMGSGVPVVLHKHIFSRVLSGVDLAYQGAFCWRFPEELLNYCSLVNSKDLVKASRLGRVHYELFHSQGSVQEVNSGVTIPQKSCDPFVIESDEWAVWVESQLTIKGMLTKAAYRVFRKLRSRL
jgi:hypothetical protein